MGFHGLVWILYGSLVFLYGNYDFGMDFWTFVWISMDEYGKNIKP